MVQKLSNNPAKYPLVFDEQIDLDPGDAGHECDSCG